MDKKSKAAVLKAFEELVEAEVEAAVVCGTFYINESGEVTLTIKQKRSTQEFGCGSIYDFKNYIRWLKAHNRDAKRGEE